MNPSEQQHTPKRGLALAATEDEVMAVLAGHPEIRIAILFGSLARGAGRPDSDLDLAVAMAAPLDAAQKAALIEELARRVGRPVDLVDLRGATGLVLREVLTRGKRLRMTDVSLYAALLRRLWLDEADFQPYRRRMLEARRRAWIGG
jgi:predicted nucleotidyltransferase